MPQIQRFFYVLLAVAAASQLFRILSQPSSAEAAAPASHTGDSQQPRSATDARLTMTTYVVSPGATPSSRFAMEEEMISVISEDRGAFYSSFRTFGVFFLLMAAPYCAVMHLRGMLGLGGKIEVDGQGRFGPAEGASSPTHNPFDSPIQSRPVFFQSIASPTIDVFSAFTPSCPARRNRSPESPIPGTASAFGLPRSGGAPSYGISSDPNFTPKRPGRSPNYSGSPYSPSPSYSMSYHRDGSHEILESLSTLSLTPRPPPVSETKAFTTPIVARQRATPGPVGGKFRAGSSFFVGFHDIILMESQELENPFVVSPKANRNVAPPPLFRSMFSRDGDLSAADEDEDSNHNPGRFGTPGPSSPISPRSGRWPPSFSLRT
ncbi:hypothetical protein BOTBODRAFT_48784 [Botryobasidium botryosum FD-172 SS1]|uniref:Uncharacterized protein n=1 Tax=Botryobasidium botryosum (strain FD-172 SS1) TaxID=930990 RepID=A0A067M6C5_BOTB1|nr:hypothetical protein BOTBODRAFT_48784 [Botryobasidium botryosum FD-172 SS1]